MHLTPAQIDALMPPPAEASEPIMQAPGYRSAQRGEYEHVGDTPDLWTRDQVHQVVHAALSAASTSSACYVCGKDTPHAHAASELLAWLRAQAARILPNTVVTIDLGSPEQIAKRRADAIAKEDQDELSRHAVNQAYAAGCAKGY